MWCFMVGSKHKSDKPFWWFVFIIYVAGLLYLLFFSFFFGRTIRPDEYRYNLKLFNEIENYSRWIGSSNAYLFWLNVLGNIVVFVPFGFIVPKLMKGERRVFVTIGLGFLFSSMVELLQLVTRAGVCDVDDIFLNTLGTVAGCIVWKLVTVIKRRRNEKR